MGLTLGDRNRAFFGFLARRLRQDVQFSRIFLVDLSANLGFAALTTLLLAAAPPPGLAPLLVAAGAYGLLLLAKIALVVQLERKGGDARQFVGSDRLVSDGPYAFSRNPVYVVSLLQSLVFAAGLVGVALTGGRPCVATITATAALALLYGHYWGMDRLVVPHEEAALRARHPDAFPAYCARVRRWLGRR
jgi:protein-S-isoprenylcysteine O-methyltransferase Ste14